MEPDYELKSECRFFTTVEVKEIKQMLLSGDREQILKAVEKVKGFLDNEELVGHLIRSDISEFLCDAVVPFDGPIIGAVYNCLELMSRHADFFIYNHSYFIVESIIRSLHFLTRHSCSCTSINQCVNLLVVVIQGFSLYSVKPEKKTIENLLQLLSTVLKHCPPTVSNKYQIGQLILGLIQLDVLQWSQEASETVLENFCTWFNLLSDILKSVHPEREKLILLCCMICHSVLRFLISLKEISFDIQSGLENVSILIIRDFLINVAAFYFNFMYFCKSYRNLFFTPEIEYHLKIKHVIGFLVQMNPLLAQELLNWTYEERRGNKRTLRVSGFFLKVSKQMQILFQSLPLFKIESDPSPLEIFFQTIMYFYSDITSQKSHITHGLCEMGFIQFTTNIVSFADFSHGEKLRKLGVVVLFQIILFLSEDIIEFSEIWPTGREDFYNEIQLGVSQLPLDASQWLDILSNLKSTNSCKLALLLYLYFYVMTAKSQVILEVIYPSIVAFIHFMSGTSPSVLIVKVVWFIFVMSQLSSSQSSSLEGETEVTEEIIFLLEAQEDLSLVYTHHPAILYWAFSSKVNNNIQSKIVHLWLRYKTSDCKELEELMEKSPNVRFAVLDILQNECGQVLDSAFFSLKTILMESEAEDVASNIWFLLPQILAKFTTDSISATNVDYAIELCSLRTPESLDVAKIIRIALLLPEVLLKSDLISTLPSLKLTFQLLELGIKMEDYRVIWAFFRFEEYVQKISDVLDADVPDISTFSLKIISLLWKIGGKFGTLENNNKISLNKEKVLRVLGNPTNHAQVLPIVLKFLQEVTLTSFHSPIFEMEMDPNFLEILFLEILNICIKDIPDTWRTLKLFLMVEPPQSELLTNPLLHEVIRFHLPCLRESQDMKEFLNSWLHLYNLHFNNHFFSRKIFGGFFTETVKRMGQKLGKDYKEDKCSFYDQFSKCEFVN